MLAYKPRLPWTESATGHFTSEQLLQLSTDEPKAIINRLLEQKDGPTVYRTMVELMRHGEGGTLMTLHANRQIMNLWQNDTADAADYNQLVELTGFFKEHAREMNFREKRR